MSSVAADVEPGDLRPDGTPADAPPGWDGEALGNATVIASTPGKSTAYASRSALLRRARRLLGQRERWVTRQGEARQVPHRVVHCQYRLARNGEGQEALGVRVYRTERRAWFANVWCCGSPWHCAICAARIARARRRYLRELEHQAARRGLGIGLHTLTTPHGAGDDLEGLLERLSRARRYMRSGRAWQRFRARWGWIGEVRTLEVTHGRNGWHPHFHALHFCERTPAGHDRVRFRRELFCLWARASRRAGLGLPSYWHGVHVAWGDRRQAGTDCVADYIAKWGFAGEVTGATAKLGGRTGGRTPWELLAASETDRRAARLWVQYAEAFAGRKQLVVTPGLRDKLEPEQLELDDIEAAQPEHEPDDDETPELVGWIPAMDWHRVCAADAHERLLEAALEGGEAFAGELARIGARPD